jgi:branched-chain amino acid transport system substrate-binding protein
MLQHLKWRIFAGLVVLVLAAMVAVPATAQDKQPIKIGFGIAETGPLGPNGKSALLAMEIWVEETNAKGGLLGRPVQLIHYDDQSNPSTVPGIYTKLLDVDKVDVIVGGYGTNMLAPAMPIVMQRKKAFLGLYGLGVNTDFKYDRYFAMIPSGPEPKTSFTKGFFDTAMEQNPKPTTVAIVAADAEFSKNASDGARENAKKAGLKVVYDKSYPPSTTDFAPIVRAIQATNADLVVICSYPLDSVGMVQAVNEAGLKPKMIGGAMVGLQSTVFKTKTRSGAQWIHELRLLAAGQVHDVQRDSRVLAEIPGTRRQGGRRSARLLHGPIQLRLFGSAGAGYSRHQEP